MVARDHDHSLAVDLVEVLPRELVLGPVAVAGEVAGHHHHVRLQLVHLDDRAVEQARDEARRAAVEVGQLGDGQALAHMTSLFNSGASSSVGVGALGESLVHAQVVTGAGHVVHADDAGAAAHGRADRGERAGVAGRRRTLGERAHEVLARDRQQQRPAEYRELGQPAQQLDRLGRRLGEVDAGVEHDLVGSDAQRFARRPCARRGSRSTSLTTSS